MVKPAVLICVILISALDAVAVYLGIQANNAQQEKNQTERRRKIVERAAHSSVAVNFRVLGKKCNNGTIERNWSRGEIGRKSLLVVLECQTKGHHQAYMLGLAAAILLSLAHAVANLLACSSCNCNPNVFDTASGKLVALFFVLSWLACGFGLTFFIQGAFHNQQSGFSCGVDLLKKHLLIYGVFASIVHGICSAIFCISTSWIGEGRESKF